MSTQISNQISSKNGSNYILYFPRITMATASAVPKTLPSFLPNLPYPRTGTLSQIKLKSLQTPHRVLSQQPHLSSNGVQIIPTKRNEMGVKRTNSSRRFLVRSMGSDSSITSTGLSNKAKNRHFFSVI